MKKQTKDKEAIKIDINGLAKGEISICVIKYIDTSYKSDNKINTKKIVLIKDKLPKNKEQPWERRWTWYEFDKKEGILRESSSPINVVFTPSKGSAYMYKEIISLIRKKKSQKEAWDLIHDWIYKTRDLIDKQLGPLQEKRAKLIGTVSNDIVKTAGIKISHK